MTADSCRRRVATPLEKLIERNEAHTDPMCSIYFTYYSINNRQTLCEHRKRIMHITQIITQTKFYTMRSFIIYLLISASRVVRAGELQIYT